MQEDYEDDSEMGAEERLWSWSLDCNVLSTTQGHPRTKGDKGRRRTTSTMIRKTTNTTPTTEKKKQAIRSITKANLKNEDEDRN